nr:TonB-dependent receptor [Zobellia laminariae]
MFKFKMKICFLLASFMLFQVSANEVISQKKSNPSNTQQNQVSGVVKDSDGIVLPGANVVVKGTTVGTQTDFDGNYTIEASAEDTLIFSYLGYTEQSILVGNQSSINVSLVADSQQLDEIVVIGYGSQKKSLVTGAITSIDSKALSNNTFTRAEQALQGRTPGVYIVPNSGAPGASPKVRIRGVSSNGNADPLYIVDGLRTRDISSIDPNDIENMEVLKDAASSAIYGSEGGNGVVIITTKSGKVGRSEFNINTQYIVNTINDSNAEYMNAEQYKNYYGITDASQIDTNWVDEVFETGYAERHNISYSSGTEKSKNLISASILNQDGVVVTDKDSFKRYSIRLNGEHKVNDWLTVGNNISYIHSELSAIRENDQTNGVLSSALRMDPLTPAVYPNEGSIPTGSRNLFGDRLDIALRDGQGNIFGNSTNVNSMNPLARIASTEGETITDRILGSVYGDIKFTDALKFTSRLGFNSNTSNFHRFTRQFQYSPSHRGDQSVVEEQNNFSFFWQWENFITYDKSFGNHNVNVVLGTSAQESTFRTTILNGGPTTINDIRYGEFDFLANQDVSNISGNKNTSSQGSYFGRLQYDYKGKYLLQGTLRRDAASNFFLPSANRWGTFPSFSAGWVISEENFFNKDSNVLNFLKLRGSWGENGSLSNLGDFGYLGFLSSVNLNYTDGAGNLITPIEPRQLTNFDLTWETSEQLDLGIEAKLFKNKVSLVMDYYEKTTRDLLTPNTPPLEAGNRSSFVNAGNVLNKGFEFALGYNDAIGDNFTYGINVNFSTLDNNVTSLAGSVDRLPGITSNSTWVSTWMEEGFPIWYYRGFKTDGIDATTGEPNFVDTDGVAGITAADETYLGDPHPDLIYGGTLNLGYKAFDLNVFVQGVSGNQILNGIIRNNDLNINLPIKYYDGRWTPGRTDAIWPTTSHTGNAYRSDLLVEDGSYTKIKQIQLGYTLPDRVIDILPISKLRTYVSLENFFTFTKYSGLDPEVGASSNNGVGVDLGYYPTPRSFIFGMSLSF